MINITIRNNRDHDHVTLRPGLQLTELVPFESLGAVSYSLSIVTVAVTVDVCEILTVKE